MVVNETVPPAPVRFVRGSVPAIVGKSALGWMTAGESSDAPALVGVLRLTRPSSVAGKVRPGTPVTRPPAGLFGSRSRVYIGEPNGPPMVVAVADNPESKRALALSSVPGNRVLLVRLVSEQTLSPS